VWGGGGGEVKRISVNPLFSAPTHGVGEGRGPIFSAYTTCNHILL
jgi:hypothetical protein